MRERQKKSKSFSRRIIKVWILGIVLPMILVEILILVQFYKITHKEVDRAMTNSLHMVSDNMGTLMTNMNAISWLLEADGTVGKNLPLYFEEENTIRKSELLIYLREQIANYEVANSSIGNLTYLLIPQGQKEPVKINTSSLASGELPQNKDYLCKWKDVTFYGPCLSQSKVSSYPCLSLLRPYKTDQRYGEIYIYLESGFKYLQKLFPRDVMGMNPIFLVESEDGKTMYSSDEQVIPLHTKTSDYLKKYAIDPHRYKTYEKKENAGWTLHLLLSTNNYYRQIYGMAFNFGLITILAVTVCIFISVIQWRSIYHPFVLFEKNLRRIALDEDVQTEVGQMNIQEFDDNFALMERLKNNIVLLVKRVQTKEKERSELEIKEILGKINPHFLYNTLDTLKWYAAGKQDKEMVHFIIALNQLLLYNMSKATKTTLKNELDAIESYITLQKLKYDIDFQIHIGKHTEILQADMPRFVIQPLVENAILHSGAKKGNIRIDIELLTNGKIDILVKNVGKPINTEKFKEVLVQKNDISANGIGLQYVARMLENHFSDEFILKAERTEDGINVIEMQIPFRAEKITEPSEE